MNSQSTKAKSTQKKVNPFFEGDKWDYLKTFLTTLFIVVMFVFGLHSGPIIRLLQTIAAAAA